MDFKAFYKGLGTSNLPLLPLDMFYTHSWEQEEKKQGVFRRSNLIRQWEEMREILCKEQQNTGKLLQDN